MQRPSLFATFDITFQLSLAANSAPVTARAALHEFAHYPFTTFVQYVGLEVKPPDWSSKWIAILFHPFCLPDFVSLSALRKA